MNAALESCRPFSSDLSLIRRLKHRLHGRRDRPIVSAGSGRAPLRVDVPLLDPCSGHLAPGSGASLGVNPQPFICRPHVPSDLWVPPGLRGGTRADYPRTVSLSLDTSPEKDWNSRRLHHSALRARINANPDEDPPKHVAQAVSSDVPLKSQQEVNGCNEFVRTLSRLEAVCGCVATSDDPVCPEQWVCEAIRHYTYTSATQRSYEEVNWDRKLPRRLKAPDCTLERTADAVRIPSSRRYHERPQLWQSVGAEWNRRQLRSQEDVRKPISFGVIGCTNPEDKDNADRLFTPLTVRRSVQPPYTPTARRTTIPGYTGRGVYSDSSHGSSPGRSIGSHGVVPSLSSGRSAPLSRMVTTTSPWNPFTKNPSSHGTRAR